MKKINITFKDSMFFIINILLTFLTGLSITNIFIFRDNFLSDYNYLFIIGLVIVYVSEILVLLHLSQKVNIQISKRTKIILKSIMTFSIFALQIFIAACIYRKIGWDCNVINYSAIDLANHNPPSMEYFSRYTNNTFLLLVKELLFKISFLFTNRGLLFVDDIFNIIMIDLAIFFLYKICKELFGKKFAYISFLISIPMLGFTPYLIVSYSDTLSLVFPVLILYNYILYKKSDNNFKNIIGIGIFATIGYLLKPTNLIALLAIIIVEMINAIEKILKKEGYFNKVNLLKYLKNIGSVICIFLVINTSFKIYKNYKIGMWIPEELEKANKFPLTHFMMMGLKPTDVEGKYYGFYLEEDVDATKSYIGTSEKVKYNLSEIKARLSKMGVKGYLEYLYDKYTMTTSDGSFFYGLEGFFYIDEPRANFEFAKTIQDYMYVHGSKFDTVTVQVMQSYWILVLGLVLTSCIICIFKKEDEINYLLKLSVIGIIMFIMLFEGRSRYLFNYIPVFIIISIYSIVEIDNFINTKKIKLLEEGK